MNQLIRNYILTLGYRCLSIGLPFLMLPILTRTLGADGLGLYAGSLAMVTSMIVGFNFGLEVYGTREIAGLTHDAFRTIFLTITKLRAILLSAGSLCYAISVYCWVPPDQWLIYGLQVGMFFVSFCDISWFYAGRQQFKAIVLKNTAVKLVSLIGLISLIRQPDDLHLYIVLSQVTMLIGNLLLWFGIGRHLQQKHLNQFEVINILKMSWVLLLPQLANQMIGNGLRIIALISSGEEATAFVDVALRIQNVLLLIVSSLTTVLMPYFARQLRDQCLLRERLFVQIMGVLLAVCLVSAIGYLVTPIVVPILFGPTFLDVIGVVQVAILGVIPLALISFVGDGLLVALRLSKSYAFLMLSVGIVLLGIITMLGERLEATDQLMIANGGYAFVALCLVVSILSRLRKEFLMNTEI